MASAELRGQAWEKVSIATLNDQELEEHIAEGEKILEELEAQLSKLSGMQQATNRVLIQKIKKRLEEARFLLAEQRKSKPNEPRDDEDWPPAGAPIVRKPKP